MSLFDDETLRLAQYTVEAFERGLTVQANALPLARAILAAHEADRWIPVRERLPINDGYTEVIVHTSSEGVVAGEFWSKHSGFWPANGFGEHWASKFDDVTHWRPLPPAPKEAK